MKKYQQIKTLIDHFECFEQETGTQDLSSFATWFNIKMNTANTSTNEIEADHRPIESHILQSLAILSNHLKHYIKTAIKATPLVGWNDLVIIIVLYYGRAMRKTELIQAALIEISPGIEVIKRLLRTNLIYEYNDPKDGRAKLVDITPRGRQLFEQTLPKMDLAQNIAVGNLTNTEKQQLIPILSKLVHFHDPIFKQDLGSELGEIIEKYVKIEETSSVV